MATGPAAPLEHTTDPLAVQVGRLDERTLAMQRQIDERFAALRSEIRGLYALIVVGFTVLGWLVTRLPH